MAGRSDARLPRLPVAGACQLNDWMIIHTSHSTVFIPLYRPPTTGQVDCLVAWHVGEKGVPAAALGVGGEPAR
jgi:hypothetical protein